MTTAQIIIEDSLRKIGVLGRGSVLQDGEAQVALRTLNNMLSSWSVEGNTVYTESKDTFTATGAMSYTIGSGGDINTTRPIAIKSMFARQGNTDYTLESYSQNRYAEIVNKSTVGTPDIFYYDNNHPLGNIYIYPIPSSAYTIHIYSVKPLTSFSSLTDDINIPAGYDKAIIDNLGVEIAPFYEKEPSISLVRSANKAKKNILVYNKRNSSVVSKIDSVLVSNSSFNIYRGY